MPVCCSLSHSLYLALFFPRFLFFPLFISARTVHEDSAETGGWGVLDKRHEEGKRVLGQRETDRGGWEKGGKREKECKQGGDERAVDVDLGKTQEEEAEKGED